MTAVLAIDLDGALGDTRPLWRDWLTDASSLLGVEPASLPEDRGQAAAALDAAGAGNWRALLGRFAEDRAPVYLRPHAEATAALRRLAAAGASVGIYTDAPQELATIAVAHVGAARRIEALETGSGALERLAARLGPDVAVVTTRADLVARAHALAP